MALVSLQSRPRESYTGFATDGLLRVAISSAGEPLTRWSIGAKPIVQTIEFGTFLTDASHQNANANTSDYYLHSVAIARTLLSGSAAWRLEILGLWAVSRATRSISIPFEEESRMKTAIMSVLKGTLLLASVFAPFLVLLGAYVLLPHGVYIGKSPDALDWMWLILLAGMMLGVYFLTVGVAVGNKKITH